MPRGCYAFSDDVLGVEAASVETGAGPSVLLSPKDLRPGKASSESFSRRSAGPCSCTRRLEFGGDKPRARDYICMHLSRVRCRIYNFNLRKARVRQDKNGGASGPPGGSFDPSTRNLILIVDDEKCMRQIKGEYLARLGYKVIEAEDGSAGVEAAIRERPRLILMNYLMPEMDGLTATEIIRLHPELRQIPIVMNSACSKDEMRQAALAAGCVDYLEEPGSSLDFLENIEAYLSVARPSVCDRVGIAD
jgi:CheY-like chemotaxis protein